MQPCNVDPDMKYKKLLLRIIRLLLILLAIVQFIIIAVNVDNREGECAETLGIGIKPLEGLTDAARSNTVFTQRIDAFTSSILFLPLYLVPFVSAAWEIMVYGGTQYFEPAFRDSLFQWIIMTVTIILKNIFQEKRPPAFAACISNSQSWGMPSGHAAWGVGLVVYMIIRKEKSFLYTIHKQLFFSEPLCIFFIILMWGLNVPGVRHELQYHTPGQILAGMFIGFFVGLLAFRKPLEKTTLLVANAAVQVSWLIIGACFAKNFGKFLLGNAAVWSLLIIDYIIIGLVDRATTYTVLTTKDKKNGLEDKIQIIF